MPRRYVMIILLYSCQVFCQNNEKFATKLPTKTIRVSNVKQENEDFNLDPSDVDTNVKELNSSEWVNMILSESLNDKNNKFNDDNSSITDTNVKELNSSEWVNMILSESLNDKNNKFNDDSSSITEKKVDCRTNDSKPGKCVLYYNCHPDYRNVIEDGTKIIEFRLASCPHYLQVCCVLDKVIIDVGDDTSSNKTASSKTPSESLKIINKLSNDDETNKCGWNSQALNIFQPRSKVVADNSPYANYGDFPWMIALIRKLTESAVWSKKNYLGGGSLIQPGVVLTVAHKVKDIAAKDLKCRAGEWDTQTTYELFPHQERDVEKIIIHPQYFRPSLYNDIALVFLKSPFNLTQSPNIGIACVGISLPSPGTECFSMGWGKEFKEKNKYAVILKKVQVPLVSSPNCQSLLRDTRLGPFFVLHESLTCAGGEVGVDTCLRDGGSSLVCSVQTMGESTRFAVFGMVGYGIGCGKRNSPSVYINVPHLKPWLDTTIANEGYTSDLYTYTL